MKAIKYHDLSDASSIIEIEAGLPLWKSVEHPESYIFLLDGKKVDANYVPKEGDIIVIRSIPGYSAAVLIVFAVIAVAGAAYAGYQAYQMRKQAEEMEKAMRAMNEGVVSTPTLRGATNQSAKDKFLPFIIGRNFFTPYKLISGWKEVEGQYQEYYNIILQCGSNQQVLETLSSDDVRIKTFTGDTPHTGTFTLDEDSPFYTAEAIGEVVQNGADFTEDRFNKCVKMIQPNVEIKKTDVADFEPVILSLPFFAKGVDICLQLDGLRYYTKDGDKRDRTVSMKVEESLDGGSTWVDASLVGYESSTVSITANTNKQFFKVLQYRKTYSEIKDLTNQILIRITGLTASYDGTALDRVIIPWQTSELYNPDKSAVANNFVDEIIIDTPERAKSVILGLRIKTTDSNADKLNRLNIVTKGIARTWSGTEWSAGKSVTSNPAAWLLEILTSSSHPPSQCVDSELDLDAFGELYEHCETENLTVNMIITEGDTKENILKKICATCFAAMYRNYAGKISVTFDGVRDNAIAVFNTQNVISFKNVKEIGNITDGIRVSYLQADAWDRDASLVMRPGAIRDGNAIIRDMSIEGVTNYDQAVYIARRIMAQELYRQKNVSVKVGQEGAFYAPLEKVLVQHPSLKIGLGSAEIKSIIMSGDNITGVELYEPVYYDSADANGFGVVIQCVSDTYCTPLAKAYTAVSDGYVTEVSFTVPIDTTTAPVVPFAGDVLSYGYLNEGAFDTITSEMLITEIGRAEKGYELKLVDYNQDIYITGAYPEYTPNITQPITPGTYTAPPATIDDIETTTTASKNPISISGVPIFDDRETCIAHCVLEDVHYLLYQDATVGSENWEIVTIEEDNSLTSFLTGLGTMNDMCAHEDKIFLSSDNGLFYVDAGSLVQVYDSGIDSIQSDYSTLYAIKDGQFCSFVGTELGLSVSGTEYNNTTTVTVGGTVRYAAYIGSDLYYSISARIYKYIDGISDTLIVTLPSISSPIAARNGILYAACYDVLGGGFFDWTLYEVDPVAETYSEYSYLFQSESLFPGWVDIFSDGDLLVASHSYAIRTATFTNDGTKTLITRGTAGDVAFDLTNGKKGATIAGERVFAISYPGTGVLQTNAEHTDFNTLYLAPEGVTITHVYEDGDELKAQDDSFNVYSIYPYGVPVPIDETVRNYGKIRLVGNDLFATVTDGHIYRLVNDELEQYTQSAEGYNAVAWRKDRKYIANDNYVYELNADGTVTAVENATSANSIIELFAYNYYLVWCPEYTPPATGTLLAAFVDFIGNVNIYQDVTVTLPSDFPYGSIKTFRKMTAWTGTPVGIQPPSGATIEGQSVIWLYDKYDFFAIERTASDTFVITDRNFPSLELTADFDDLDGLPINSCIVLRKTSETGTITITAPGGTSFEGLSTLSLSAQYSFVELERISATLFAIRNREESSTAGAPVGVPVAVLPPATLSTPFFECNGQMIDDSESIFDNTRLPNLNGAEVVLTLTFTSDAGGSYATCPLADIPALGLHDWVTGSGIADHTWIASVDYSTGEVILSDTAASGSIVCTFWNEGRGIIGGAFGSVGDQGQKLTGEFAHNRLMEISHPEVLKEIGVFKIGTTQTGTTQPSYVGGETKSLLFDSSGSPDARTSADTWGKTKTDAYRMKYYMRIK